MSYLSDTNIFLEILLGQSKREKCKAFLKENIRSVFFSEFSFHSIGVILIREKQFTVFENFLSDLQLIEILSLPKDETINIINCSKQFALDFDDAYQLSVIKMFNLKLKTMDMDFKKVKSHYEIEFLD